MPTRDDIQGLAIAREDFSVTVYVPTSPVPVDAEHNRLAARALFDDAIARMNTRADKEVASAIENKLYDLLEDTQFWRDLGRSLAVFVTPTLMREFRLPNELEAYVSVSDRFSITPILRAITFPHAAFVLAISENGARLVKTSADMQVTEIPLDVPDGAASAVDEDSAGDRASFRRLQDGEGRKVRLTQFARAVDHGMRPVLNGQSLPLIIAATEPLLSIFRNLSGYAHVAPGDVRGNPDELSDAQLAEGARDVLDNLYRDQLAELQTQYFDRKSSGRALSDLSDLAQAAVRGALATLVVDMDAHVAGSIAEDGSLTLDPESPHNVLEEIARLALAHDARVLSIRASDLPGGGQAAGILRYTL